MRRKSAAKEAKDKAEHNVRCPLVRTKAHLEPACSNHPGKTWF